MSRAAVQRRTQESCVSITAQSRLYAGNLQYLSEGISQEEKLLFLATTKHKNQRT